MVGWSVGAPGKWLLTPIPARAEALGMISEPETQALLAVVDRLAKRFPDTQRSVIEDVVADEHSYLDDGPIRDYVPVLVERAAKLRLKNG